MHAEDGVGEEVKRHRRTAPCVQYAASKLSPHSLTEPGAGLGYKRGGLASLLKCLRKGKNGSSCTPSSS